MIDHSTHHPQAVPFILFGIGLDDAYVLFIAYGRTDPAKDAVERIHDTMKDVGISIYMTTATSVAAFALGCISTVPAIRWMCIYAFVTIAIDFVYQITFFIALIVLDEERIKNRRRDCLICCKVDEREDDEANSQESRGKKHIAERFTSWYADKLLVPWVKAFVLIAFTALLAGCAYSASLLKLEFDFSSVLPSDSYVKSFTDALDAVASRQGLSPHIYFRGVDQSNPAIHAQMEAYVNEIVSINAISDQPFNFWLRDYYTFATENDHVDWFNFNETFRLFLQDPKYDYNNSFILDSNGRIEASRTVVHMDNVRLRNIDDILDALRSQRRVSSRQPINQRGGDWAFFTFDPIYYVWEFLAVTVDELTLATIVAVAAVSAMSILFLPHWSGVLFVGPLIAVLYVDLMGFVQVAGVDINGGKQVCFFA